MAGRASPEKLLHLASLFVKTGVLTSNGAAFFKELVLRRDPRLDEVLELFEAAAGSEDAARADALLHGLITEEAERHFERIFAHCSLDQEVKAVAR